MRLRSISEDLWARRNLAELLGITPKDLRRVERSGIHSDPADLVVAKLLELREPAAADAWLRRPTPRLGDHTPMDLLRLRPREVLAALAAEHAETSGRRVGERPEAARQRTRLPEIALPDVSGLVAVHRRAG